MKIAKKLQDLAPYDPTTQEFEVVLDANESFLQPEGALRDAIDRALHAVALNRYPDPTARALCAAAARYYGVAPEQVVAGNGSDELISILLSSFLDRGDTVAIANPDFSMYAFYAHLAELAVADAGKRGLAPDADAMIQTVAESGAALLIFSNPCNPSGQGLSRAEVLRVVRSCDALVVVDEAYMEFWDQSVADAVGEYPNLIVLRTCSKALGLAAARCGFALANEALIGQIKKAKSPFNVNSFTQAAALAILENPRYISECIEKILASREDLYQKLRENGLQPVACQTNFVLIRHARAKELWQRLRKNGISVRHIMGDYLRITAGTAEENTRVAEQLKEALA